MAKKTGKWYDDVSASDAKYVSQTNQALADRLSAMGVNVGAGGQQTQKPVTPNWQIQAVTQRPGYANSRPSQSQSTTTGTTNVVQPQIPYAPSYSPRPMVYASAVNPRPAQATQQGAMNYYDSLAQQLYNPGQLTSQPPVNQPGIVPRLRSPLPQLGDSELLDAPTPLSRSRQSAVPTRPQDYTLGRQPLVIAPGQLRGPLLSAANQGPIPYSGVGRLGDAEVLDAPAGNPPFQVAGMVPEDFRKAPPVRTVDNPVTDYNATVDYWRENLARLKDREAPKDYQNPLNSIINAPPTSLVAVQVAQQASESYPATFRWMQNVAKWIPYAETVIPAVANAAMSTPAGAAIQGISPLVAGSSAMADNARKATSDTFNYFGIPEWNVLRKTGNLLAGTGYTLGMLTDAIEAAPVFDGYSAGEYLMSAVNATVLGGDADRPVYAPPSMGGNVNSLWAGMNRSWDLVGKNLSDYLYARGGPLDQLSEEEQIAAKQAMLNTYSGEAAVAKTYDQILNRDQILIQKAQEAQAALEAGNMLRAAEIGKEVERLEHGTWIDIVDQNMRVLPEIAMQMIFDPLNLVNFVTKPLGLVPEARRLIGALRASRIDETDAIARVTAAVARTTKLLEENGTLIGASRVGPVASFLGLTNESRATQSAMRLYETYAQLLSSATTKQEAYRLMTELATTPANLLRGLDNIASGTLKIGGALVGNDDFTKAFNVLAEARKLLPNLESLTGEGPFNILNALQELDEVTYAAARRVHGLPDWDLPMGTMSVRMVDVPNSTKKVLEYVGAGAMETGKTGKPKATQTVISRSAQMTLAEAQQQMSSINAAIQAGVTEQGWYRLLRFPDRVQRAIISELNMNMKPSYWVRNAASAYGHLITDGNITFAPTQELLGDLQRIFAGALPTQRLAEGFNSAHTARAIASTGLGAMEASQQAKSLFRRIWPNSNPFAAWSEFGAGLAFGNRSIPLGAVDLPVGEQNFYLRGFATVFKRALEKEWGRSLIASNVAQQLIDGGFEPAIAKQIESILAGSAMEGRQGIVEKIRSFVTGTNVIDWKALGIPDEALTPSAKSAIERLAIENANDPTLLAARVDDVLHLEETLFHQLRNEVPPSVGREVWTKFEELQDAQETMRNIQTAAKKAGIDPVAAMREMQDILKKYQNVQSDGFKNVMANMTGDNLSSFRAMVTDVWDEVFKLKNAARQKEIELAQAGNWTEFAKQVPALWEETLKKIDDLMATAQANIGAVRAGEYKPRGFDVWNTMERLYNVNDDAIATVMRKAPKANKSPIFAARVNALRTYIDKYAAGAYLAAQRYGGDIETIDLLLSAEQKAIKAGEQVSGYVRKSQQLFDLTKPVQRAEFYKQSAIAWNDYAKTMGAYWQAVSENIVAEWARKQLSEAASFTLRLPGNGGQVSSMRFSLMERTKDGWRVMDETGRIRADLMPHKLVPAEAVAAYERAMQAMNDRAYSKLVEDITNEAAQVIEQQTTALALYRPAGVPAGVPAVATTVASEPGRSPLATTVINEIRELAKSAGIDTVTQSGKAFDNWLVNVAKKDLNVDIKRLSDLTPEQADELMGALRARIAGVDVQRLPDAPISGGGLSSPAAPPAAVSAPPTESVAAKPIFAKNSAGFTAAEIARAFKDYLYEYSIPAFFEGMVENNKVGKLPLTKAQVKKLSGLKIAGYEITDQESVRKVVEDYRRLLAEPAPAPTPVVVDDLLAKGDVVSALPVERKSQSLTGLDQMGSDLASGIGDSLRESWRQSVIATGRMPSTEQQANSLINQVFERLVVDGYPRDASTVDTAILLVERSGNDAKRMGQVYADYRATWQAPVTSGVDEAVSPVRQVDEPEARTASDELREIRAELADEATAVIDGELANAVTQVAEPAFEATAKVDTSQLSVDLLGLIEEANKRIATLIKEESDTLKASMGTQAPSIGDIASFRASLIRDARDKILAGLSSGVPATAFSPEQQKRVMTLVNQLLPKYDNALYGATRAGRSGADFTMLDYSTRHGIDNLIGLFSTYHFWHTRSARNWLERIATKPRILAMYFKAQEAMDRQNADMPVRATGAVPIPGTDYRIQHPSSLINPLFDLLNLTDFADPENASGGLERALETAKGFGFGLSPLMQAGMNYLLDQQGPREDGTYRADDMQLGDYIWLVRMANHGYQAMTGQVGGGEFLSGGDQFDYGRVGREIALEVWNGTAPERVGRWALDVATQVQKGVGPLPEQPAGDVTELYERAARAAGFNQFISSIASNLLGLRVTKISEAELAMRGSAANSMALGYDPNRFGSNAARDAYGETTNPNGVSMDAANSVYWGANSLYERDGARPGAFAAREDLNDLIDPIKDAAQEAVDAAIAADPYMTSKEIRAVRAEYEQQIEELKKRFPSVEKFEPTPEQLTSMYSDYNPDELNDAARESAVYQARRELEAMKPADTEKPGDPPEYKSGSNRQEYEAYKRAKEAYDAAWDNYNAKWDSYDTAVEQRVEEIINSPRMAAALVGGWPTGYSVYDVERPGYPEPTSMGSGSAAIDQANFKGKSDLEIAQLRYDAKMQDIYGDYLDLSDSDKKRKFLKENPDFEKWLSAQEKKKGRDPWWEKSSSSGGGYAGSSSNRVRARANGSGSRSRGSSGRSVRRVGSGGGYGGGGSGSSNTTGIGESGYLPSIEQLARNTPRITAPRTGLNPVLWEGILQRLRTKK